MDRKFTPEELQAAYRQMQEERSKEHADARLAAEILNKLLKEHGWPQEHRFYSHQSNGCGNVHIPSIFSLTTALPQYGTVVWKDKIKILEAAGVKMKPWSGKWHDPGEGGGRPNGEFDLTNHPEFPESCSQKVFHVYLTYLESW